MDQHDSRIEQLQAELDACRKRIAELEATAPRQLAPPFAQQPLSRRLLWFEALASALTDAVLVFDAEGKAQSLNPAARTLLGFTRAEDWLGKSREDLLPFERPELWRDEIEPALNRGGVWQGSIFSVRPDGKRWHMYCTWFCLVSEDGTPWGHTLLCRSITGEIHSAVEHERLHAELAQRGEELRVFKTLADQALDGIALAGTDTVMYYANPAFQAMSGFGDRIIGMRTMDLADEQTRMRIVSELRPAIAAGGRWDGTVKLSRPDGEGWMAQTTIMAFMGDGPMPVRYAAIHRDVTEQLRQEEALRHSEARHRALLDAIPDLIVLVSTAGVFVDYKAESTADGPLSPETWIGRRLEEALPPGLAMQMRGALEDLSRTRQVQVLEYSLPFLESLRHYEGRLAACGDDHAVLITRDITQRKEAEQERLALQAQMMKAQEVALRQLATPVIPIADGVIAIPLIGAIDAVRADQILEALLHGIAANTVQIAILDITGVEVVDVQIAQSLLRAAQAARLLGAQVVLTGIGANVARTLVDLGAGMEGIVTRSTLKSGIAYALR